MKAFFKVTAKMMLPGVVSGAILSWITLINEACLKREHPFETDKPEDGQREFDDEQRRDLQDDP